MSTKLTVGSLFAGIGGFDLGLERAGFEIKWQVEIEPYAQRVLAKHWPHVTRYGDIRAIEWADVEPADVVCGGFPCQPHSLAGKRAGAADERDLWPEFVRCIRGTRPRWVVAENVRGLLSNDFGRFFGGVLRDLAESGYDVEWDCIPASAVGAPHQRDRVWIVAYPQRGGRGPGGERVWMERVEGEGEDDSGEAEEPSESRRAWRRLARRGAYVADPSSLGHERAGASRFRRDGSTDSREDVADANDKSESRRSVYAGAWVGLQEFIGRNEWWRVEPNVGRVVNGVPRRVDRLRGLGNAIVPQIAEWIGRRILEAEAERVSA